jgi:hypothetical protein
VNRVVIGDYGPGMNETITTPARLSFPDLWGRSPLAWKIAAIVAAGGWWLQVGGYSKQTVNGVVTSCDGLDAGPFIVAAIVAGATLLGIKRQRGTHPARRLPPAPTRVIVAVLLAAATFHLLRGLLDPAGSYC